MSNSAVKETARAATTAVRNFKRSDPLVVRKKAEIEKIYFRRSDPKHQVARVELAFDGEQYVAITLGIILLAVLWWGVRRYSRKRALRKAKMLARDRK